jgi:hypothetical protein
MTYDRWPKTITYIAFVVTLSLILQVYTDLVRTQ